MPIELAPHKSPYKGIVLDDQDALYRQTAPPHTVLCKLAVFSSVRTVSRRKLEVFRLRPNEESGVLVLTDPIDFFEAVIAFIEMLENR